LNKIDYDQFSNEVYDILRVKLSNHGMSMHQTFGMFAVQSIGILMERMAWWFWMMRQPNGCSKPASTS